VGFDDGDVVSPIREGRREGLLLGLTLGNVDIDGRTLGIRVGRTVGPDDGLQVGYIVGLLEGISVGTAVGCKEGE
jgi:hypothetical protein